MEQISKNFKMSEFEASDTASAQGINNRIPEEIKPAIRSLVKNLLQPICDATGWQAKINSGYRSPKLNSAVGGVPTSQHLKGEAADCKFYYKDNNNKAVYLPSYYVMKIVKALNLTHDQMIAYNTFVHLSYDESANRKQTLYNSSYNGQKL